MDISTASPAEIDGAIAERERMMADAQATVNTAAATLERIYSSIYYDPSRDAATIDTHTTAITEANATIATLVDELAPLRAEFTRRGGWTRYFLVDAHNGHVHSSTRCSTCFPTTTFYWLTSESGAGEEEVVDRAQSQACTVCFSWAPVTDKPGRYTSPSDLERQERAAGREARAAAKRGKQITNPDGTPLRINRFGWQTIQTTRTAEIELVDLLDTDRPLATDEAAAVHTLLQALAAKKKTTVDDELAAARHRLTARRKRERR